MLWGRIYLLIGEVMVGVCNKGKQLEQERFSMAGGSLIQSVDEHRLGAQNCPGHFAWIPNTLGCLWNQAGAQIACCESIWQGQSGRDWVKDEWALDLRRKEENFLWCGGAQHEPPVGAGTTTVYTTRSSQSWEMDASKHHSLPDCKSNICSLQTSLERQKSIKE